MTKNSYEMSICPCVDWVAWVADGIRSELCIAFTLLFLGTTKDEIIIVIIIMILVANWRKWQINEWRISKSINTYMTHWEKKRDKTYEALNDLYIYMYNGMTYVLICVMSFMPMINYRQTHKKKCAFTRILANIQYSMLLTYDYYVLAIFMWHIIKP